VIWRRIYEIVLCCVTCLPTFAADTLRLEAVVPLGAIAGRIDHLAVDLARKRLYVAELGNDSVGVLDLANRDVLRTLTGFDEPQGVAFDPSTDTVYVANGGDGSLRWYSGDTLEPAGRIELHDDADNIRIDLAQKRIVVGFGKDLALVDARSHAIRTLALDGHPESFQIDSASGRVLVNVPSQHALVALDPRDGSAVRAPIKLPGANFPMALDDMGFVLLPLRHPARLLAFAVDDLQQRGSTVDVCEDADDAFFDVHRKRLYVSCGDGHVDVFERRSSGYSRSDRVATAPGARTSLYVSDWDRLFVAVPDSTASGAAIWIMAPN